MSKVYEAIETISMIPDAISEMRRLGAENIDEWIDMACGAPPIDDHDDPPLESSVVSSDARVSKNWITNPDFSYIAGRPPTLD